jgi:hypothetical protein
MKISIGEHWEKSSGSQRIGLGFTASLRRKCADLAALPGQIGRPRPELGADIRSVAFHGYVIVFLTPMQPLNLFASTKAIVTSTVPYDDPK